MERVYIVKKLNEDNITSDMILKHAEKAEVSCFPWDKNRYMPKTEARVVYTEEKGFTVFLVSHENEFRAEYVKFNDPVCKDSCMEFFFNPNPAKDERYMNFELNPLGTLYLGIGKNRFDSRIITDADDPCIPGLFGIKPNMAIISEDRSERFWSIQFFIPFSFIEKLYGKINFKSGMKMIGNFYKCGDDTKYPHYGCWNKVVSLSPDFHRPESFGILYLE